jgi:hypothetical protein
MLISEALVERAARATFEHRQRAGSWKGYDFDHPDMVNVRKAHIDAARTVLEIGERALTMQAQTCTTATGAPLGSVAQMLGITGVLLAPIGGRATVQTRNGSFTAPAHIAQWLATN